MLSEPNDVYIIYVNRINPEVASPYVFPNLLVNST